MTRWLCVAIMGLSVSVAACSSDGDEHYGHTRHSTPRPSCSEQLTCGTCTPVLGCGWCQYADGTGRCAMGPSACGDNFRWNWEPDNCPAVEPSADAGTDAVSADAPAADAGESDAAPTDAGESDATEADADAAVAETSTCTAPSGLPAGCAQSFGGTLCSTSQYTVGCIGTTSVPTGCTKALTEGATTHYCCPCE